MSEGTAGRTVDPARPVRPVGRVVRWFGLILAAGYAINTLVGYGDIASDASVRAFAPLVLIEGAFFVAGGLLVAYVGARIERSEKAPGAAESGAGGATGENAEN